MEDFNSKYSGEQIEALLDQIANGDIGGGIETETDPIFSASPAATITEQKIVEWNSKSAQGDKGDKGDTGVGVQSVAQTTTSNADGGSNVVTVTLTDGTKSTFTVKNGSKGSQGIQGIQGEQGVQGIQGIQGEKGDKGDKGDTGANGSNGVSVSSVKQTTTSTADGGTNVVTVTLSNGTTSTFSVKNGSKGSNGTNGTNGKDGATFTPSVDSAGNLSWSNNKGLANPPTVNIKGPKGDAGSGGGGSSSGGGKEFVEMESKFEPGGYIGSFGVYGPMEPNKVYVFSQPINTLYVNYINESGSVGDEYTIMFTAREESPLITISDYQVYWANGTIPSIAVGDMCELSLVRIGNVMKATLGIFNAV